MPQTDISFTCAPHIGHDELAMGPHPGCTAVQLSLLALDVNCDISEILSS